MNYYKYHISKIILITYLLLLSSCQNKNIISKDDITIGILDTSLNGYRESDLLDNHQFADFVDDQSDFTTHGDYIFEIITTNVESCNKIEYCTVSDSDGQTDLNSVIEALKWIRDNNIRVCNLSLATYSYVPDLDEFEQIIHDSNTLFIVSAGNQGLDLNENSIIYPACLNYENVITVAAVDKNLELMEDSNYGNEYVDIAYYGTLDELDNHDSGTSFAAANVTAIVYNLLCENPDLTNSEIKELLLESCDQSLTGLVKSNGVLSEKLIES